MFEHTYLTIAARSEGIFTDRGSKFISLAAPVKTEQEVKELLQHAKSEHPKANHHCYAFRLGPSKSVFRYSDDREPSGTAGKPIYGVILSNDLTDIVIIVSRIFGGSLLGVQGLIQAYRSSAAAAIANAEIVTAEVMEKYRLRFGYPVRHDILDLVKQMNGKIVSRIETDDCEIDIEISKTAADNLLSIIRKNHLLKDHCSIKVL